MRWPISGWWSRPSDDLAFERIVNTPKRGLGDKAQQKIQVTARENGVPLIEGARRLLGQKGLTGKGAAELAKLLDSLARWGRMVGDGDVSHIELAEMILDESGYTEMWQNDKTPEAPGRLENLKELVKALEGFENLQGFLEHVSLIMDNETEEAGEKVTLMTLHAAKGLEFPVIFLPGWEDGLFPSQRSMDESGTRGLEEERRLAYVGITRAEEVCTISFAGNRRVYGQWQARCPRASSTNCRPSMSRCSPRRASTGAITVPPHRGSRPARRRPMSTTRPAGVGCNRAAASAP